MVFELLPKYHAGSAALVWLAPAYVFFSIANLQHTMLLSSGDSRAALTHGLYARPLRAYPFIMD